MDVFVPFSCDDQLVGRDWVFAKVAKTLDIRLQCPSVTVILGATGSGKTMLLRQIYGYHRFIDHVLACYECSELRGVQHFIASVEQQIQQKIQFKQLADGSDQLETHDDIFRQAILFPLLELNISEEQRYVILIDSIDVNADVCQLISNHIHLFPKWLHLIVSARPKRRKGFPKMFSGSRKIVIDDMRKVNVINDMKTYIMHRIKKLNCGPMGHSGKKALNQIGIKSNGCFLFVKLVLDCLERGLIGIEQIDEIGATLNGLYLALCTRLFDSNPELETHYKMVISLILASTDNKIKKYNLQKFINIEDVHINQLLDDLCLYSMLKISHDVVEVNHTSIIEWVTDIKYCGRRFLCDKSIGHVLISMSQNIAVNELHYHVINSSIETFQVEHYALWLLFGCSSEDIEILLQSVEDCPVVDYIDKCQRLLREKSVKYKIKPNPLPFGHIGAEEQTANQTSHVQSCSLSDDLNDESDYSKLTARFYNATVNCDITTLRDLLNNDSEILNNPNIYYKQKSFLFWAIKSGNSELVELFIEFDADVNTPCDVETHLTPLMVAVSEDNVHITELLLEADADVDACDSTNKTSLVYAILNCASHKIVEMLLFWGAHTDYLDDSGRSLLCLAANESQCSVETIRLLLAVGCDELHRDNNGRTALHLASAHGNYEAVEALLEIGGDALLLAKDNEGKIALHDGAASGHLEMCKILIADETKNALSHDGKSPLRVAALHFHLDVLTLLVESGADVNYVDADGRSTVYCIASFSDDLMAIKTLTHLAKLGADLEIKDFEGRTCLHVAAWQGFSGLVEALINLGADVNAVDSEGRTALHMCAWNGYSDIVNMLVEAGSDVNSVSTTQGATPLLIAAQQGHIDACSVLLAAGSNPNLVDFYGRNAQDVASNCGHRDIAILIENYLYNSGECPTLSSHASTAETAAIGEIEALLDYTTKSCQNFKKNNSGENSSRKHKKMMSLSKLTKLLH